MSTVQLADLTENLGFRITGLNVYDQIGWNISSAGDFNHDGIEDFLAGRYLIFGDKDGFSPNFNLISINGTNGFLIEDAGGAVASAGDVNGDGINDIIYGRTSDDPNGIIDAGATYVLFGKAGWSTAAFEGEEINGENGFAIEGINESDYSGYSVSSAGDFNGDGVDDIIIGAPNVGAYNSGAAYVVFGVDGPREESISLDNLDGTNGFVVRGIDRWDYFGAAVSTAGDFNGDGLSDIIAAAPGDRYKGNKDSESYVIYGRDDWNEPEFYLDKLDGDNGFKIESYQSSRHQSSISLAGDINNDGIDDIIIGSEDSSRVDYTDTGFANSSSSSGASYVIFGNAERQSARLSLEDLNGRNGFKIIGEDEDDVSGFSVSRAGDVNDDGIPDFIIGAPGAESAGKFSAGESYIIFGSCFWDSGALDLRELSASRGVIIGGIEDRDFSGAGVSYAGDINGDGIDDVIIGAPLADPQGNNQAGEIYIIYGARNLGHPDVADTGIIRSGAAITGTASPDLLQGDDCFNSIHGLEADDIIFGGMGNDELDGGEGTDTAVYSGNQASYTVQLSASGVMVTDRRYDGDGSDELIDVENLRFSDGDFNIDIRTGAADLPAEDFADIVELYIAYFNRAPASKGLLYWADRLADDMPLPKIAESFFVQPETQNTYAEYLDDNGKLNDTEAFVKAVFNNVLGRDPYGPYWINELNNNPAITPAIFILAVLNGAKAPTGGAEDREFLANKTDIGIYFSAIKGLSDYDDTISVMGLFDGTEESVDAAVTAVDAIYEEALDPNTGEFLMPLVGVVDDPFVIF